MKSEVEILMIKMGYFQKDPDWIQEFDENGNHYFLCKECLYKSVAWNVQLFLRNHFINGYCKEKLKLD